MEDFDRVTEEARGIASAIEMITEGREAAACYVALATVIARLATEPDAPTLDDLLTGIGEAAHLGYEHWKAIQSEGGDAV